MAEPPQQSLRKHRQTVVASNGKRPDFSHLQIPAAPGSAPGPADAQLGDTELPAVALKDRQKVGDLVKKRLSSRVTGDQIYNRQRSEAVPALPSDASNLILQVSGADYPLPPIAKYGGERQPSIATSYIAEEEAEQVTKPLEESAPQQQQQQQQQQLPEQHVSPVEQSEEARFPPPATSAALLAPASEKTQFLKPEFDAKQFISDRLNSATDVQISDYADQLARLQEKLSQEQKDAMYSNYRTFLAVGNRISALGSELETVRKLLTDLNLATAAMSDDAQQYLTSQHPSLSRSGSSNRLAQHQKTGSINNRNSVLMLENMWQRDLTSLFRHVEGAQKYLPVIPGRHLIREKGGWYQLNAATWKPLQPIHMFLLNDHLLIAAKKRNRQAGGNGPVQSSRKLIADQCWPLLSIEVVELISQSSNGPQRALCVKRGGETYIYSAEKAASHDTILADFRRARDELEQQKGSSHRASHLSHSRSGSLSGNGNGASSTGSIVEKKRQSMYRSAEEARLQKEIEAILADIDVAIAHRNFSEVVDRIERHYEFLSANPGAENDPTFRPKDRLDERVVTASDLLLEELSRDYLSRAEMSNTISCLVRLRRGSAAKKTFLDTRHALLQRRVKQIDFQGDIPNFIFQVATVTFQLIASTVDIFRSSFRDPRDASTIMEWAKAEVDRYVMLFARQLHKIDVKSQTYQDCYDITKRESMQLEKLGVDLGFSLSYIYESLAV